MATADSHLLAADSLPQVPASTAVRRDSRLVVAGDTFVAMAAEPARSLHIAQACERGAALIIAEQPAPAIPAHVQFVAVADARWAFSVLSARSHQLPREIPLIGVTGTDGKTSVVHAAHHCLGPDAARIGSLGLFDGSEVHPSGHTTPPPEMIHEFLAQLPMSCPGVALEISSHAGHQHRLAGLPLQALAYTGLGIDHLDYHKTEAAYRAAKLMIVDLLAPGALFVVQADDPHAAEFIARGEARGAHIIELGMQHGDARLQRVNSHWLLHYHGERLQLPVRQPGGFNAWNAAAGLLLAHSCGVSLELGLQRLATYAGPPGRLELCANHPATYVDYACTPESIGRVLVALRESHPGQRLVCVFGCGGDRYAGKRGLMGQAALAADQVIITTDNPRHEDPSHIAEGIIAGFPVHINVSRDASDENADVLVALDRATAIRRARESAGPAGVVAVLGKGHETYQQIGDAFCAWDDRAFVRELGAQRG